MADTVSKTETRVAQAALLRLLWDEFHRLNLLHFKGELTLSEIIVSTRKQYGGYYQPARKRICISWLAHVEHGLEETLNTFRHEVAHIVHPDHSRAFWQLAESLGCTRRHALPPTTREHAYCRYTYECPVCQSRVYRRKRLVRGSCGRCDNKFNPDFQLRLVSSATTRQNT